MPSFRSITERCQKANTFIVQNANALCYLIIFTSGLLISLQYIVLYNIIHRTEPERLHGCLCIDQTSSSQYRSSIRCTNTCVYVLL